MGFVRPELLLLLLPGLWLWWRARDPSLGTNVVRLTALVAIVLALAAPYWRLEDEGRDLVVVVDRSLSMPREGVDSALELIRLAEGSRVDGDRVAVVGFGAEAAVETLPDEEATFTGFARQVDANASDLADGLEAALQLIPEGRQASVLVISDGDSNGRDPLEAARRAFARGIRVDVRPVQRPAAADLSVERLDLPSAAELGEPFQFSAWVETDRTVTGSYVLRRGDRVLSRGERTFEAGFTRLLFRDVLNDTGVADYTLELTSENDRVPENNRGLGALHAQGPRRILVLNDDGREDTLTRALARSGVPVDVFAPEDLELTPVRLTAWRGIVLENVSANRLGTRGMEALADFVVERGGGLLMTGGKGAFGVGGYHLTAVDELLPVSMELRQEHRKQGVSLILVLDRSGSMSAGVDGGRTKMDLANQGSAAAIELLSPLDSVGLIAVDSEPHVIQDLVPVENVDLLTKKARSIESMGGGIYVYSGLLEAGRMLDRSTHANRHIVLFSDAADSEEQEGVPELVERMKQMGTTVSVIALGTEFDQDAAFLRATARQGDGEIYFTTDATELPKLFAQDTLQVARSTFLEQPTSVETLPGLFGLGDPEALGSGAEAFPVLDGYNLNYLREGAIAGAVTQDEYRAPILAFWNQGLGRSAAVCTQVGGTFGEPLVEWPGFAGFFVTLARWLAGTERPTDLFPTVRRVGDEAILTVEVDPNASVPVDTSKLSAKLLRPDGTKTDHLFERTGSNRFETRLKLDAEGVTLGTLRLADGRFEDLPPMVLPYSPEFERQPDPTAGERLLRRLAQETGGEVAPAGHTLLRGERATLAWRIVSRELMLAALLLLLLEVAGRRLGLWSSLASRLSRRRRARAKEIEDAQAGPSRPRSKAAREAARAFDAPAPAEPARPTATGPRKATGAVTSALDRARHRAGRRTDR